MQPSAHGKTPWRNLPGTGSEATVAIRLLRASDHRHIERMSPAAPRDPCMGGMNLHPHANEDCHRPELGIGRMSNRRSPFRGCGWASLGSFNCSWGWAFLFGSSWVKQTPISTIHPSPQTNAPAYMMPWARCLAPRRASSRREGTAARYLRREAIPSFSFSLPIPSLFFPFPCMSCLPLFANNRSPGSTAFVS